MLQPLDSVLVRVQAGTAAGSSSLTAAIRALLSSGGGARSLWKGATPMMWSVPAQNALLFAGYGAGLGWCSKGERQHDGNPSSLWHVFAGGCAGGFAQVSCCLFARALCMVSLSSSSSGIALSVLIPVLPPCLAVFGFVWTLAQ